MSGHSKWHNIQATKSKADAARGNINSKLYDVIQKAKQNNMSNDNIQRSIKKASGGEDGGNYDAITYEGYGAHGVAFIVECLTDNRNRTAADVRHLFDKFNGSLGTSGSVTYMFDYKGIIRQLILKYKFRQKAYLFNLFSRIILIDKTCLDKISLYDTIIPIPMFEKKKKQRGYNQTELIVRDISKNLNIDLQENNLIKIKNTKTQSTLSQKERKENIKGVFLINNIEEVKDKKVIIFDDIFTTGETVNEASKILKQAGVKEILVFVIAKD